MNDPECKSAVTLFPADLNSHCSKIQMKDNKSRQEIRKEMQ